MHHTNHTCYPIQFENFDRYRLATCNVRCRLSTEFRLSKANSATFATLLHSHTLTLCLFDIPDFTVYIYLSLYICILATCKYQLYEPLLAAANSYCITTTSRFTFRLLAWKHDRRIYMLQYSVRCTSIFTGYGAFYMIVLYAYSITQLIHVVLRYT